MVRKMFLVVGMAALLVGGLGSHGASATAGTSCSVRFPEAEWLAVSEGPVSIEATGIAPGLADRFTREAALVEGWINEEIGPVGLTLCLAANDSGFDGTRYVSGSQRFHAHMEMDEQLLVINTERFGFVGPAIAWSMAHHALWQAGGSTPHPEPISSVVGQWYRARILDRLDLYHRDVMVENFFDTDSVIDWTETDQAPMLDWDPERNFQAIGDFIDFAVSEYGTGVLLERDGERWSVIEAEWRVALRADLTGRTTPTTDWRVGVAIVAVVLVIAVVAIGLGVWSKHRRRDRPDTAPAIPGFFSDS